MPQIESSGLEHIKSKKLLMKESENLIKKTDSFQEETSYDDEIFNSSDNGHTWERASGRLTDIAVSGDGLHLWEVNMCGQVYYRRGFHGKWVSMGFQLASVAVSHDGAQVWGVNKSGFLWTCESPW